MFPLILKKKKKAEYREGCMWGHRSVKIQALAQKSDQGKQQQLCYNGLQHPQIISRDVNIPGTEAGQIQP